VNKEKTLRHDPYAALRVRDYRVFITARFFLTLGIQIQSVVVGLQVYEYTKDPLWLGMIGLAEAIPFICTALFGGHVADIVNRKKIIITATTVFVLCTLALMLYPLRPHTGMSTAQALPIYGIIFITGIARAFLGPAFFAFQSQLISRDLYANAATWSSTAWQIGAVTGQAMGGLLFSALTAVKDRVGMNAFTLSYFVDGLFVLVALLLFITITSKPLPVREKREPLLTSVGEGVRFVFNNQVILGALSLDLFAVFFGGAVALLPFFANEVLHVGATGYGFLRAAPAAGALLMALAMAYLPPQKKAGRNLLFAVAGFGLCMIIFGISKNFYLSLIILALSGALDSISVVVRQTILQLKTPDHMRGRVSAVNSIFIGSSNEIGEFESGLSAKLLGLIPSVIFGGSMTMLVVLITGKFAPQLKAMDLHKEQHNLDA
jgi:MFS family permease